ncbi:DNA repair protein RecO [Gilvibacter sp. SZ-19]|jgi:DNA repair protein RecO (recombination protein O)|uniref:DNA repair protein RecO n=1 Tax=Gilvibacter sp. SZ-19 TaxID=754429 RepID=UPI000B3C2A33|nr:DNA repair protein RecO [Gilvibacter sp. SZ-19]ARV12004.1 DNA repair protein RecO [Gilvibacter sp. SZ-19]
MHVTTPALVISSLKYGEADLIVKCYTRQAGLKSYLLRGILKSKKGKLKKALFLPLSLIEIEANHKDNRNLEYIKEARLLVPYQELHTDIVKQSLVMFLAEMLQHSIQEEEPNSPLFDYLAESFVWLDEARSFANFHIVFLLQLSRYLGFYPDDQQIELPCFHLLEGRFTEAVIDPMCNCEEVVGHFKQFFGIDFDASTSVKVPKSGRLAVLNLLLRYYQLHLQNYKAPQSLTVLNQLF